jgi:hypothetical protein
LHSTISAPGFGSFDNLCARKEEEDQDPTTMGERDVEQSVHELVEQDEAKRSSTDALTDSSRGSNCTGNDNTDDFVLSPSEEEEGRRSVRID